MAGTFDEVFLSRPGRDVHALVAAEGDEVVVDPGGSREEMPMRSFDDLLDRLAFGWVIRCGEGRPARDKVNRGETLFAGRVCSGDLAVLTGDIDRPEAWSLGGDEFADGFCAVPLYGRAVGFGPTRPGALTVEEALRYVSEE